MIASLIALTFFLTSPAQATPVAPKPAATRETASQKLPPSAPVMAKIKAFYQSYLNAKALQNPKARQLNQMSSMQSKIFQDWVKLNHDVCERKAPTEVCGWGSDFLIYLGAQDFDTSLTFANAKFDIRETTPRTPGTREVAVTFDLFPKNGDPSSQREIHFVLAPEKGVLKIDDIMYVSADSNGLDSAVKSMRAEINSLLDTK